MSITLHPAISELDKDSLRYSIYSQLYSNFFNAQDAGTVTEGDWISVRLHNTAYGFAEAISSAVGGEGESGGVLIDYIKRTGGDMSGVLRAKYGFEAGYGNTTQLATTEQGIEIYSDVYIGGESFYLGGHKVLSYNSVDGTCLIDAVTLDLGNAQILSRGSMLFGENKDKGVYISQTAIQLDGKDVYHRGNANLATIDWAMKDAAIEGALAVKGSATLSGELIALNGFQLGVSDKALLSGSKDTISAIGFLSFGAGYGVKIADTPVLVRVNDSDIRLSGANGDLLLGSEQTSNIRLFAGLTDIDGDNILISKYGDGYFPASFKVRHNYGADLLSTYRTSTDDEGVIIHQNLRFGTADGAIIKGDKTALNIVLSSQNTSISQRESTSLYKPLDRESKSLHIITDSDFIIFDKPIEGTSHIGIDGSHTRLTDKTLYFTPTSYIQSIEDGIKHFGNATFTDSLSSERFASGFAGYGWSIIRNATTANTHATFDELTIRKKMRIYELEVQKNSATNGSLWISDSCSGDVVEIR